MYEDDPQDTVFDVLGEAVFGDHPLGPRDHRPRATVDRAARRSTRSARLPRRALRARQRRRRGRRLGRPRPARRARRSATAGGRARRGRAPAPPAPPDAPARAVRFLAQGHRAVPRVPRRARASPRDDERRFALRVLDSDPRRARPRRGCSRRCARSAAWPTRSTRSRGQYAGHRPDRPVRRHAADNVGEAMEVVGDELERLLRRAAHRRGARARARRTSRAASCWRWSRRPRG